MRGRTELERSNLGRTEMGRIETANAGEPTSLTVNTAGAITIPESPRTRTGFGSVGRSLGGMFRQAGSSWDRMRAAGVRQWCLRYPACSAPGCRTQIWNWERLGPVWQRVWLEDLPYCPTCLPPALHLRLALCRQSTRAPARPAHRIPLGLLLISRGWLTPRQLRAGLGRQRRCGGRLGNALCELGYTDEDRIAAGLAMQWACPILTLRSPVSEQDLRLVPRRLQELHGVIPVHYAATARILVLAFSQALDYGLMQAIGGMLDCRVEPCVATETQVHRALSAAAGPSGKQEIAFERVSEVTAQSAIGLNYIQHWGANRVRIAGCGRAIWARLERSGVRPSERTQTLDLLFETPAEESAAA